MKISSLFNRVSGTIVNFDLFVIIFHLFSKVFICSIACLVLRDEYLLLYEPDVICVMSSANAMYSVEGSGRGRSCVCISCKVWVIGMSLGWGSVQLSICMDAVLSVM